MNRSQASTKKKNTPMPQGGAACSAQVPAGSIQRAALHHQASQAYRYVTMEGEVFLRLRAATGNLRQVEVCYGNRYEPTAAPSFKTIPMVRQLRDEVHDWFEASLIPEDPRLFYFFRLTGQGSRPEVLFLQEDGFHDTPTLHNRNLFFFFPHILPGDMHDLPDWARGTVVYQVFPDRFARAAASGVSRASDGSRLKKWGVRPKSGHDFYGGNLEGIRQRIPHLVDLGIDVLYLTPLFLSRSAHRYDTDDYFTIDPLLGGKEDLRRLVGDLHGHGIRVVLDAVFNHCGPGFFAFADVLEKGEASRYKDWFFLDGYPVDMKKKNYATFASAANMPKLNAGHPDVRDYLCEVGRYWIREADIDGWRIDVANEVDPLFWRHFRDAVREEKPDTLIIGEIWGDSTFWLGGDMFDGVMHYPFTFAAKSHFAEKATSLTRLDHQLNRMAAMYTHPVRDTGWTLLESHDTERFLTAAGNDPSAVRLAAFLQFAFPGSPMVYYGAEAGMEGGHDPDCRRCMNWGTLSGNPDILSWYRQLIAARRALPALRRGSFRTVLVEENLYAFARTLGKKSVLAMMNESDSARQLDIRYDDVFRQGSKPVDFLGQADILKWSKTGMTLRIPANTGVFLTELT